MITSSANLKNDTLYKLSNGKTYNQEELDELIEKSREMNSKLEENRDDLDLTAAIGQDMPGMNLMPNSDRRKSE